ncbi:MFS transporter [Nanchangia anserum]|uniref:MFS transporter n=1 Tax=Nanchangia anserum TaxID=2692125 RepID=UPI001D1180ED|nr:MFS transporter [Nanchangia anserum]
MSSRKSGIFVAAAVITLELIGGIQSYLNQLILPILAKELGAQHLYGAILGVSSTAATTGLPIGATLLGRLRLSKLLLGATFFLVLGSLTSALAPNVGVFIVGSALRGLAGSILAMTSIGAVALGLSGRARQLTLAFASASWVIASVVGPTYAAWVTHLMSWRWAMVLYLPFLVVARLAVAVNIVSEDGTGKGTISYKALILIVLGVTATVLPVTGMAKVILLCGGVALLGRVVVLLLPAQTFSRRSPRRAALAGMFFLTGSYFAANELVGLTAHDIYGAHAESLGYILTGGGLAWAILGVVCGYRLHEVR